MELDRRRFLRVIGATGASAALSPLSAIAIDDDLYSNSRLGFSLMKPSGWHFNSVRDITRIADHQEANLARPELQRELLELAGLPILVITKYADDDQPDRLSPNIQVNADPITSESPETYLGDCYRAQRVFGRYFENYQVEREMRVARIGDTPCGDYEVSFEWVHANIRHHLLARTLVVMSDTAELALTFMGTRSGPDRCERELSLAMKSIRLG